MPMQSMVRQVLGEVPVLKGGPTTQYGAPMVGEARPKIKPKRAADESPYRHYKPMRISVDELRRLYESGTPVRDLVKLSGVSRSTIIRHLGDSFQPQINRVSDDVLMRAVALRKQGVTWAQVQDRCGYHSKTIYKAAKDRGFL